MEKNSKDDYSTGIVIEPDSGLDFSGDEIELSRKRIERMMHLSYMNSVYDANISDNEEPYVDFEGDTINSIPIDKKYNIVVIGGGLGKSSDMIHNILKEKFDGQVIIIDSDYDKSLISECIVKGVPVLTSAHLQNMDPILDESEHHMDRIIDEINTRQFMMREIFRKLIMEEIYLKKDISKEGTWPTFRGYTKNKGRR